MPSQKSHEKRSTLLEQVTLTSQGELKIDKLLSAITEWEAKLRQDKWTKTAQNLITLYNKAIEYYSAIN